MIYIVKNGKSWPFKASFMACSASTCFMWHALTTFFLHFVIYRYFSLFLKVLKIFLNQRQSPIVPLSTWTIIPCEIKRTSTDFAKNSDETNSRNFISLEVLKLVWKRKTTFAALLAICNLQCKAQISDINEKIKNKLASLCTNLDESLTITVIHQLPGEA